MAKGERFNALTHLAGAVLTLGGLAWLVVPPLIHGEIAAQAMANTARGLLERRIVPIEILAHKRA